MVMVSPIPTRSTDVSSTQLPITNTVRAIHMNGGSSSRSVRPRSVQVPRSSISRNSVFEPLVERADGDRRRYGAGTPLDFDCRYQKPSVTASAAKSALQA